MFVHRARGDHDDWQLGQLGPCAHVRRQFQPVHVGHFEIRQQHVGARHVHGLHGLEAVARERDVVAMIFEQRGDGAAHGHGVVDDEHARAAHIPGRRTSFGGGAHRLVARRAGELGDVEQRNHAAVTREADAGDPGNALEIAAGGARHEFAGFEHRVDQHADGSGFTVHQHEVAALGAGCAAHASERSQLMRGISGFVDQREQRAILAFELHRHGRNGACAPRGWRCRTPGRRRE